MKRGLQIFLGIASLIPLVFGSMGAIFGAAQFIPIQQVTAELDSQFRFQSAYYFGLAVLMWWVIPNVEKHTTLFRIIIGALFFGGVARVYSYMTIGPPPAILIAGTALELALPLLILWQNKIRE